MAYTSLNFVPGEILTAAKMNLLAANDASFRDGTGFSDDSIQLSKIINTCSTEERIVGKWIDGKSIYEKVITFSNLNEININTNFETIVDMKCMIRSNQGQWRNLPWLYGQDSYADTSWHGGFFLRPDGKIVFQTGSNIAQINYGHIIFKYTKN